MRPSVGASLPCLPRTSLNLDVGSSSNIDSALKDFKLCIRRIQTVFASFQVELQLLDRLYYRGNNQHRTALFWRRIIEARRYGNRILAMDIHTKLDGVRMLFWNHE